MYLYLAYLWLDNHVPIFGSGVRGLVLLGIKYADLGIVYQMLLVVLPLWVITFKWLTNMPQSWGLRMVIWEFYSSIKFRQASCYSLVYPRYGVCLRFENVREVGLSASGPTMAMEFVPSLSFYTSVKNRVLEYYLLLNWIKGVNLTLWCLLNFGCLFFANVDEVILHFKDLIIAHW